MKKNILLLVLTCFIATYAQYPISVDAQACYTDHANFYAKFLSGANFLQNSTIDGNKSRFKTGYIVDVMLGYCWPCGLRLEAEYAFRKNGIKQIDFYIEGCSRSGYLKNSSIMVDLLWDLPVSLGGCIFWNIQPFIGGGLGCDFQKIHSSNSRIILCQKWKRLSWQVMAGLTYPILCNTAMTLEYKFHQGGYYLYNHSVGLGLAHTF